MENVPDPTDFPLESDAPGLRTLDSAFRCRICGELYDAPMILNCGHSFCSMCVRRSLRDRRECPSCRNPAEEIHLVKNVQLEELCDSWQSARNTVLNLIGKMNELTMVAQTDGVVGADSRPKKRRKTSARSSATPGPTSERERESIDVLELDDSDVEMVPSSDAEENEAQIQLGREVACPICSKQIVGRYVNEHIDSGCKSFLAKSKNEQANSRNAWSNILANGGSASPKAARTKGKKQPKTVGSNGDGSVERIPKPSYNVLKDKKLREMLLEYQLPTSGTREQLVARHAHFVLLFNANLDRAEYLRKSISELRRDLKRWEDGQESKRVSVDDTHAYLKRRDSEFKKHVEAARSSLKGKAQGSSSRNGVQATRVNGDALPPALAHQGFSTDTSKALLAVLLSLSTAFALGPLTGRIRNIVTFGDSYTQVEQATGDGGQAWPVYVADYAKLNLFPFARAGATCSNNLTFKPFPSIFGSQLPLFLEEQSNGTLRLNQQETVYTLWIGTNDVGVGALLTGDQTKGVTVVDTVSCAINWVRTVYRNGARNFIFQNMIPSQDTILYSANSYPDHYWLFPRNTWHTSCLKLILVRPRRVDLFDSHSLFTDIYDNPSKYPNGTAPLNVIGAIVSCVYPEGGVGSPACTIVNDLAQRDSFMWFDELHPSEQTDRTVARHIPEVADAIQS